MGIKKLLKQVGYKKPNKRSKTIQLREKLKSSNRRNKKLQLIEF